MATDYRLLEYFKNARMFHQTKDEIWLSFIEILSIDDKGPAGRAALRMLGGRAKKRAKLDSG